MPTLHVLLISVVHLWLHLAARVPVVHHDATHVDTEAWLRAHWHLWGHAQLLLLLHIQALHLNQLLHVLRRGPCELTLHLLHGWSHLLALLHLIVGLLHLELHVVENAIEVDGVELNRHFDRGVLLEVH